MDVAESESAVPTTDGQILQARPTQQPVCQQDDTHSHTHTHTYAVL